MSTYAERLIKIDPVDAQIFGGICRFYRLIQQGVVVTLVILWVTRLIFINFAQDVATILPLDIF